MASRCHGNIEVELAEVHVLFLLSSIDSRRKQKLFLILANITE